jgi:hypothetical protein
MFQLLYVRVLPLTIGSRPLPLSHIQPVGRQQRRVSDVVLMFDLASLAYFLFVADEGRGEHEGGSQLVLVLGVVEYGERCFVRRVVLVGCGHYYSME